jgi:class 3 adenylate cyclase/tetratricopeptide (TPR) repeat protein
VGRKCPSCAAVVALDVDFCTSCGSPLGAEAPASTEERKIVSVLFADLVGFTARAESLDPEEVRAFLAPYFARVRRELERFGGTVEKFIGDAVMALFGAPVAHEDDPERAVRAALAVREAIAELNSSQSSPSLQIRIGITTGEALVTRDARPSEGEGMAAGDVVNTAARLQSGAPVDGILVDEATYRATEHAIEYRPGDPVEGKGKAEPVPVWEAVAPKARLGVDIAFRGGAALVGRDDELDALRDALARARRERTAQLVTLVGVPGIGKSRLVYELWATLEDDPELVYWRQGRSLPYGGGVSFWALGEMAKAQAGILESDGAEMAQEKLRTAVAHAVTDTAEAAWIEGHLRPLVGLSGDEVSGGDRSEAFDAWRRFFEGLAEEHPLVLVFEDLHWADDGLLEFVDHLVEWTSDVPLLVVCTARPELLERRAGWGGGKRNAATLSLSPLSDADTASLVQTLMGESHPDLVAHAGGNPLYAEEYARMLAQSGNGGALALPATVQGIIAARLDTLPVEEKALVQDAAVLGKVFWAGEVVHVAALAPPIVDERLHALERKEFIRRERRSSVAGETAYVFRHSLVRDVAYGQIPRSRRAEKHVLAAEWIESLARDRHEDLADMVAHHYLSALEITRAAGQEAAALAERARFALRDAGDRATRLHAPASATQFYEAALESWPQDDPERPDLLYRYGNALRPQGTGDDVLVAAAEELLDAGDPERSAESQALAAEVLWIQGRHEAAFEHLEGAAALLADEPPSRAKVFVLANLARYRMTSDEAEAAVTMGSLALEMAEELGLDDLRGHILSTLGTARTMLGDRRGLDDLHRAVEIAEELNVPEVIRAKNNLASTYGALGDLDRCFELMEEARTAAERFGWSASVRWLEINQLDEHYARGRWDEAVSRASDFLAEKSGGARHMLEFDASVIRALIRLARDDLAGAQSDSGRGLELARKTPDPQSLFPALACHAWVLAEAGESDAEASLVELLTAWSESPASAPSMWFPAAAYAAAQLGRSDELIAVAQGARLKTLWLEASTAFSAGDFQEAARLSAQIGSQPDEALARLRAAEILLGAGRRAEGESELQLALEFFRRVGAARFIAVGEALLAAI